MALRVVIGPSEPEPKSAEGTERAAAAPMTVR